MFSWFNKRPEPQIEEKPEGGFFSTHFPGLGKKNIAVNVLAQAKKMLPKVAEGAMDDASFPSLKLEPSANGAVGALGDWYASQGFIGWQMCALLAQNWLVDKACSMPARDATRNGWDIATVNGDDLDDEIARLLKAADKKLRIKWNAEQLVRMGRIFGIRLVVFKVDSTDPQYYEKPFNPDGVTEGSYKGIAQVDPYWCAPLLDAISTSDPASMHFYEPTWWIIGGQKYHRSHLHIFRSSEPADVLKPMYMYGGIPVPQKIMERVYAAERVANEGPLLATSKRTNVWLTNMSAFLASGQSAIDNMNNWVQFRDNYGIKIGDKEADEFQQFEISLGDLDSVIMTSYQIVAAAANVPATKLLGTAPKGFNSTGEYEESSYHEELESIQEHDLTAFIEKHHLLTLRSSGIRGVETTITWRPLDAPTSKEVAETNLIKAQGGNALVQSGAITAEEERQRIAADPDSGYFQLGTGEDSLLSDLGFSGDGINAAQTLGLGQE